MDNVSDSYYEENSEAEEEVAGPLHVNVNVNLEDSPEFQPRGSLSPVLPPPSIAEEEWSP